VPVVNKSISVNYGVMLGFDVISKFVILTKG